MSPNQQSISYVEESILTLLKGYELYGLEIMAALVEGSGGKLKLGYGTLYPTLRRLEKKELVQGRWGEETPEERGRARRRYYKVTAIGARTLHELQQMRASLKAWTPLPPSRVIAP